MSVTKRHQVLIFGAIFGAWIGLIYAWVSQAINWILLPGIAITPPPGGLFLYIFQYAGIGALLGIISSIPENRVLGMVLGGFVSTVLLTIATFSRAWGQDIFGSTVLLMMCTFMPLIVLLAPIALLIRAGVDAQNIPQDRPYLWARRYLIPIFLTVIAVGLGLLSMFSKDHRQAIEYVNVLIQEGSRAGSESDLPKPLLDVPGFLENGQGPYTLTWSDRTDTFFGPRPVGAELSQFLVIASFENGFSFACVFSTNRSQPNCALY